jgi:N-acetylneuraminic acid mutarotase
MLPRGRQRAPISLLIAACLGISVGVLAAPPASAATVPPAATVAASTTATSTTAASTATNSSTTKADATQPSATTPAVPQPPASPQLQKLAAAQPDYTPAGCDKPDPAPGEAVCFALVATSKTHSFAATTAGPPTTALGPAQIQAAYDLPDTGQGQTVALVDAFGDSSAEADLATFRAQYGLPPCTTADGCFRKVDQTGGTDYPADDSGWGLETSLDLDAVSSVCPACHILLVEANTNATTDLSAAAEEAVNLGAKFVSNSYGIPGESPTEVSNTDYDHPGVAMAAAAGDYGNVVDWPASDPDVIAVGGTTLTSDPSSARGWDETAWSSGGSGCSAYEPQPAYQANLATGCANRAINDLSADADPNTGLAVYDTLGQTGWTQVGGTSLATPLVAAMYALAGTPAAGTYPVTYPYAYGGNHMFDITQGSDGGCGTVQCNAGPGWDGPTGLGTPDGVTALALGSFGTVAGKVTTGSGGVPVAGANVVLTDAAQGLTFRATTNAQGAYSAMAAAGDYSIAVTAYGYKQASQSDVDVAAGQTTTTNITLTAVPSATLSGTVADGSGHGWPLYAEITVSGDPNGPIYTNPKTGAYSVTLPDQTSYTLNVAPVYQGYETAEATVALGTTNTHHDFALDADQTACVAPGYAYPAQADFEGWTGSTGQGGWTVTNNDGSAYTWEFDDPNSQWNLTGGSGNFGTADPYDHGGAAEDTDFVSPVMDLTKQPDATLQFDTAYLPDTGTGAEVDASSDGGTTWSAIWQAGANVVTGPVEVPLTGLAGHADIRLRFHYSGSGQSIWELDDVTVGTCSLVGGGIVEGVVTDGNTGQPLNGAVVADKADPATTASSAATPDDPNLSDGFYWLFSQGADRHTYTTASNRYATLTSSATTVANAVVQNNLALQAGLLAVSPASLSVNESLGQQGGQDVILTNKGRAPLHVTLGEQGAGSTTASGTPVADAQGAPLVRVPGDYPNGPAKPAAPAAPAISAASAASAASAESTTSAASAASGTSATSGAASPSKSPNVVPPTVTPVGGGAWQSVADYPEPIMDNAVGNYQGRAYSVGGVTQIVGGVALADSYVYDPTSASWSAIAPLPQPLESPVAAFLNGTMYVAGGWNNQAVEQSTVYAYHPSSNTWTQVASLPQGVAAASIAVLDGSVYVIGGCTQGCAEVVSTVYRYSPSANTWTSVAAYPVPEQWSACAGVDSELVCAGGDTFDASGNVEGLTSTYIYQPKKNAWTQGADMPYEDWGMASSGANGELQIVGGIVGADGTNQAEQYDPVHNVWTALPNAVYPVFRGGGASCGMYQVGGAIAAGFAFPSGNEVAQVLPGFDQCGGDQVPWLAEDHGSLELAPGQSARVHVTVDANQVEAPGNYEADLTLTTDTPYVNNPVPVKLHATAPRSWGEISGTVTAAGSTTPLAGATVQICAAHQVRSEQCDYPLYTVTTDAQGTYALWLPGRSYPLDVTVTAASFTAQGKEVTVKPGADSVINFALAQS